MLTVDKIASRIKELREILELTPEQLANDADVPVETYNAYENGMLDIPIGKLYLIASAMNVDPTVLMMGDEPRMVDYTVVRAGQGISVERYKGYRFSALAYNYIGREMEPMIVTLEPEDAPPKPVTHEGQEFNYVIEGVVAVTVNGREILLNAGDSIYFNPALPHGQRAAGNKPAKFLTVINE